MRRSTRTLAGLTALLALAACRDASDPTGPLALTPSAPRLQGGVSGGGSGGGGGGGGGGGSGGTTAPATKPTITSLVLKTGYGPYGGSDGDLEATWKVDMGTSGLSPLVRVRMSGTTFNTAGIAMQTIDYWNSVVTTTSGSTRDPYLPLHMSATVTIDILDAAGNVLDSKSATDSTPATPRLGTTAG